MTDAGGALREWRSFFGTVGSSAATLTGLQFVVLTLVGEASAFRPDGEALSAFGSPNVIHFCAALLVSALFSAPWYALEPVAVAVGVCGVLGLGYSLAVLRRALRQRSYQPVLEDWIWHALLPTLAYAALLWSGIALLHALLSALYVAGAATLLLLFIGIHNAWDTITYIMLARAETRPAADRATAPDPVRDPAP